MSPMRSILTFAFLLLFSFSVAAVTWVPNSLQTDFDQSNIVFQGRVTSIENPVPNMRCLIQNVDIGVMRAVFENVSKSWKGLENGPDSKKVTVFTCNGKSLFPNGAVVAYGYPFEKGKEYIVFAQVEADNINYSTHLNLSFHPQNCSMDYCSDAVEFLNAKTPVFDTTAPLDYPLFEETRTGYPRYFVCQDPITRAGIYLARVCDGKNMVGRCWLRYFNANGKLLESQNDVGPTSAKSYFTQTKTTDCRETTPDYVLTRLKNFDPRVDFPALASMPAETPAAETTATSDAASDKRMESYPAPSSSTPTPSGPPELVPSRSEPVPQRMPTPDFARGVADIFRRFFSIFGLK